MSYRVDAMSSLSVLGTDGTYKQMGRIISTNSFEYKVDSAAPNIIMNYSSNQSPLPPALSSPS